MEKLVGLLLLTGLIPWWQVRRANLRTSLSHAVHWAIFAWLGWLVVGVLGPTVLSRHFEQVAVYVALCLTGCAGVAVLGARRPGVQAWSFVVVGLLAVFLLQLFEGLDRFRNSPLRVFFLGATLAIALLNYLPTRLGVGVVLAGIGMVPDLLTLAGPESWAPQMFAILPIGRGVLALSPWAAWAAMKLRPCPASELDKLWLDFRDRFGLIWGQRTRDQFNRAAANAQWPVYLGWCGLAKNSSSEVSAKGEQRELVTTLQALLRRFGAELNENA